MLFSNGGLVLCGGGRQVHSEVEGDKPTEVLAKHPLVVQVSECLVEVEDANTSEVSLHKI